MKKYCIIVGYDVVDAVVGPYNTHDEAMQALVDLTNNEYSDASFERVDDETYIDTKAEIQLSIHEMDEP